MNQRLSAAQRRQRAERWRGGFRWYLKTAGVMLLTAIVCAWAVNMGWSVWLKIGFSESTTARLPAFAFFAGLAIGLGTRYAKSVKEIVGSVVALFALGAVFSLFGLLVGVLLILVDVPTSIVDWMPWLGFGIGALLGAVGVAAVAHDQFQIALAKIRAKLRTR